MNKIQYNYLLLRYLDYDIIEHIITNDKHNYININEKFYDNMTHNNFNIFIIACKEIKVEKKLKSHHIGIRKTITILLENYKVDKKIFDEGYNIACPRIKNFLNKYKTNSTKSARKI